MALIEPYFDTTLTLSTVQILKAFFILSFGLLAVQLLKNILKKLTDRTNFPEIMETFVVDLFSILLYSYVILITLENLGLKTSSVLIGISAVIGLVLGLGMQDTITNLMAGTWVSITRPIDKEELVNIATMTGKVLEVSIMSTRLITEDGLTITIPNKVVWGSPITNYSRLGIRRADLDIEISYKNDLNDVVEKTLELVKKEADVLKEPAPDVIVSKLTRFSINIQVRFWIKAENHYDLKAEIASKITKLYKNEKIEIAKGTSV
ncbi:small-conductance mechanosensitive channel [Methanococcus maripaludis]|uniref:Small-conductance mechanosensitive channel n=1 Tax=Methanococcus maripaludis TaxID=39152 RepID=A0A7J9NJW1_METMI|nr:mechanosensitive ion channel domain-containing protein [Methanococcus maripaludis]MBA2840977.1 small-conductance mechanosensitive channel [Methanococcus maripaludis]